MSDFDFTNASPDDFNISTGVEQTETQPTSSEPISQEPTQTQEPVSQESQEPVKQEVSEPKPYSFKDDFIKGVVDYYEKTGDLTPYIQAKTTDFTTMSDEEIMRRNLREQYSELSDKAFDKLYKQEVIDKFKLDSDEWSEDDSELGKELLKVEANKLRNSYIDWQKNFRAPEPEISKDAIDQLQKFEQEVKTDAFTQSLLDGKRISIKTAEGEFNYEVPQAETLVEMTLDNQKFFSQFANQEGKLDYAKWYKTAAYSQNPELFEKSLINYGKTLGRSEVTKEIKNPSTSPVGDVPTDGSGDFMSGLLSAFASRGIHK